MPLLELGEIQKRIRTLTQLTSDQANDLCNPTIAPEIRAAVLAGLLQRDQLLDYEVQLITALAALQPDVFLLFERSPLSTLINVSAEFAAPSYWHHAINALIRKSHIGTKSLAKIVDQIAHGENLHLVAALSMSICIQDMQHADILDLTRLMADSGTRFDYRHDRVFEGARLIRRYPTGALSEKIALILPALIACAANHVNVFTPFLVARSLGYTGGTWDKLSSIPGFQFPAPGDESIDTLLRCRVAMTVTQNDANPADRILYQLRSITGTIESMPLMVSSIASKQMSFPVHRLMMDVRYGNGAFLDTEYDAQMLGEHLQRLLTSEGISTFYHLTNTDQPTGSAIGNALEVAEALAVMKGTIGSTLWNTRALAIQRDIAVDFFALLMVTEFPEMSLTAWRDFATHQFVTGQILKSFANILLAHKVPARTISALMDNPLLALNIKHPPHLVLAQTSGTLAEIKQRHFGELINYHLNAARTQVNGNNDLASGAIIVHRLRDQVCKGEIICKIFSNREVPDEIASKIQSCFVIESNVNEE